MEKVDYIHAAIHFVVVVVCIPFALDPLTAGLASVIAVEADQKTKGQPWLRSFRDLVFRGLGALLGIALAALTGNLPILG